MSKDLTARLPSPNGVALAIMDLCQNETSISDVAALTRTDPALTARLIAHANAAATGGRAVVSVADALARMGLQSLRRLVQSFSLIDQYGSGQCSGFDYTGY